MRALLLRQMAIPWSFAERFVFPQIDEVDAHWEPARCVVGVRQVGGTWRGSLTDESIRPMPRPTIAWSLWHLHWRLANTIATVSGRKIIDPQHHAVDGSVDGAVAQIRRARDRWVAVVAERDPDEMCVGPMPELQQFAFVACWVNIELTKNVTEIHDTLALRRAGG